MLDTKARFQTKRELADAILGAEAGLISRITREDLELLLRLKPRWRVALQDILFKEGDIVEHGEEAEEAENHLGES